MLIVKVVEMVGVLVLTIVGVSVGAGDEVGVSFAKPVNGVGDNWVTATDLCVVMEGNTNRLNKTVRRMTMLRVIEGVLSGFIHVRKNCI